VVHFSFSIPVQYWAAGIELESGRSHGCSDRAATRTVPSVGVQLPSPLNTNCEAARGGWRYHFCIWRLLIVAGTFAASAFVLSSSASAGDWLPHPSDATWTYEWTDSSYNQTATMEKVTVKGTKGAAFTLAWTTEGLDNAADAPTSTGTVSFQETNAGLINTDWTSNAPPVAFPILCASVSQCGNSLASTYYNVIWGARTPTLAEPLLKGLTWSSSGGTGNDVGSTNSYLGTEKVTVPAFREPVMAAKVRSDITQAGALGDPYGSGVRTVWWVAGVGPVKVRFEHAGGRNAPVTTAVLQSTSLAPKTPPTDVNYFPLVKGKKFTYRWINAKYFPQPVVETATITAVVNGSAQLSVQSMSGPLKVQGAYGYTTRQDGVTNIWGTTKSASLSKLPELGPAALDSAKRRHFVTPFDLMNFGFNPLLPAYAAPGDAWVADTAGRDWEVYGVRGSTRISGLQTVTVPAGTFRALVVGSTLKQDGFPFGSGTRTMWFAPDRGLVKLVFRHADGTVSRVELLK
jgi:hypothetical protein